MSAFAITASALTVVTVIIYIIEFMSLRRGIHYKAQHDIINRDSLPGLSVIIACKNSQSTLPGLFSALKDQQYPPNKFEVVFINDNSSDATADLLADFCTTTAVRARVIDAANKPYPAKKGALAVGISQARYDYLAITDSDCVPEPLWLMGIAEAFTYADMVVGPAPFIITGSIINTLACYEQFKNYVLMHFLASVRMPYTATARNFGFTRTLYNACGGYTETLQRNSGDDDLLLQSAIKKGYTVHYFNNQNADVYSYTPESLKTYIKQKARHISTSHVYPLKIQVILALWHGIQFFSLFSLLLIPFSGLFLLPFLFALIHEIVITIQYARFRKYKLSFLKHFYIPVLREIMVPVQFLASVFWNRNW